MDVVRKTKGPVAAMAAITSSWCPIEKKLSLVFVQVAFYIQKFSGEKYFSKGRKNGTAPADRL